MAQQDDCPTTPSKCPSRTAMVIASITGSGNTNNIGSILSDKLDVLPKSIQFICLALCVFFFFGIHNVLQEAMINTEGFTFGVMLGWMEVLGVTLCSGLERSSLPFIGNGEGKKPRLAPWQAYPPLTFCLLMSSSLASWSLNYINFPTKVRKKRRQEEQLCADFCNFLTLFFYLQLDVNLYITKFFFCS